MKNNWPFFLIFAAAVLFFWPFQFNPLNPYFSGEDAFYHVGMANFILDHGIVQKFPWLYFTTINANFVDHQLLFHLLLIPFMKLIGTVDGPKIMEIIFFALSFAMIFPILREKKLKLAWLYPILLFALMPADFYFRMSFIRVQAVSLFLMMLALYLIIKNKPVWLGIISFLFVWLYGGSVFLPVLIGIYFVSQLLSSEKISWKVLAFGIGGFVLGILINPYFPKNIGFLFDQIFKTGLGAQSYSGGEWRSYETWYWVKMCAVPILIFFGGLTVGFINGVRKSALDLTILIFSIFLLVLQWKAMRFVEYWPFWGALAGLVLGGKYVEQKIAGVLNKPRIWSITVLIAATALSFFYLFGYFDQQRTKGLADSTTNFDLKAVTEVHDYLKTNSAEGDIVFTDDWDVFPLYFYLNQKNYYLVGLDPEFMNQYNHDLFEEFAGISSGSEYRNLDRIKNDFKAKWVLVADDHRAFRFNLLQYPDLFDKVFDNSSYYLFKVK
ncbi:MAG: hypothetical protein WC107_05500 [Patescibacteria group bacterium]